MGRAGMWDGLGDFFSHYFSSEITFMIELKRRCVNQSLFLFVVRRHHKYLSPDPR